MFDFRYTCPEIDNSIKDLQSEIESVVSDILDDACPLLVGEPKIVFMNSKLKEINSVVANGMESLRELNSEMRDSAEKQINEVNTISEELQDTVESLEEQIEELNKRISSLEDEIIELENK